MLPDDPVVVLVVPTALCRRHDGDAATHPGEQGCGFEHPFSLGPEAPAGVVLVRYVEGQDLDRYSIAGAESLGEVGLEPSWWKIGRHHEWATTPGYWAQMYRFWPRK